MWELTKVDLPLYLYEEITDLDVTDQAERLEAIGTIIMRLFPERFVIDGKAPQYDYDNKAIVNGAGLSYTAEVLTRRLLDECKERLEDLQIAISTLEAIADFGKYPETED